MPVVPGELYDAVVVMPVDAVILGRPVSTVESVRIKENLSYLYGVVLRDAMAVRELWIANQRGQVTLSDAFKILDQLARAQTAALSDGVGIRGTQLLQRAAAIIEKLGLLDTPGGGATYHMTLVQGLRLATKLAAFLGASVLDTLGLSDDEFVRVLGYATAGDTIGVGGQVAPKILMSVKLTDGIELDATQALRMLYQPTLVEGVEFEAGYLAPDGSFTTWVMNTRSAAVSEYDNFVFNSFAQVGSKYLGASADGLFELLGDDDDGEAIIARVKGGFMQFGGPQLSRLKEAYIAASEGGYVLRIRTADDEIYNYRVDAREGRSTKFHMGKGQRSRYFAFELVTEGQDFELDTLEFVPLVVQRRV